MPYINTICTSELLNELGIDSEKAISQRIIGHPCAVDSLKKSAAIAHPFSHSTYPDRGFTFVVKNHALNVWGKPGECGTNRIEIFVGKESEYLSDDFLIGEAKEAFSVLGILSDSETPIHVKGRTPPPKPPRAPAKVIAGLNKYMQIAPPGVEELAKNLFVPILVRSDELDAFLGYVSEAGLDELSLDAQELFREVIERLISERK